MTTSAPPSGPPAGVPDWANVTNLSRIQRAYCRPAELKAGRVDLHVLRARMKQATGDELAAMRSRGELVAMRLVTTGRGHRPMVTTEVTSHEEARPR
jgi:hypothetical protein